MLSSTSDKAKLFAKIFSKNSNLDDSVISLSVSPSRAELYNISVTPKMVKKGIKNFDASKASGLDSIPVVVLKNCEPKMSYILAEPPTRFSKVRLERTSTLRVGLLEKRGVTFSKSGLQFCRGKKN